MEKMMKSKYSYLEENILKALKLQEEDEYITGLREMNDNPEAKKAECDLLAEALSPLASMSRGLPTRENLLEIENRKRQYTSAIDRQDKKQAVSYKKLMEHLITTGSNLEELRLTFHMLEREGLIEPRTDNENYLNGYSITSGGLVALRNINVSES